MSKRIIFIFTLFSFMAWNAHASSLDELVNEVLEKNPELKSYQAEIEAAEGSRTAAGIWANPEFGASLGQKKTWNEDDEFTAKGEAFDLSVSQSIEWPGRLGLRKAIAQREIELAELGLEQFRAFLRIRAILGLYNLYAAREIEAASQEISGHFRALKEVLAQRSPAGLTPLLESRIIEAMELNMQRKATQASLAAQVALNDWNLLRGSPTDTIFPQTPIGLSFEPLQKDRTELLSVARSNDYSVRQYSLELKRQDIRVGLTENERLPAVSVGPFISQERAGDRERVVGGAISMPFPLWNLNQGNIDTERARRSQAEVALDLATRDAERRVIETALAYENKLKEISSWKPETIQHFKEAAELADRHYRLGAVPVTVYVELQTQYLEALQGLHDTRKEALEAALHLEFLTNEKLASVEIAGEKR